MSDHTTVRELVELIDRARMALTEAGRPDLAERAHVVVDADGTLTLSCAERRPGAPTPELTKFVSIDPLFEPDGGPCPHGFPEPGWDRCHPGSHQ